jgi:hypothetical protein
MGIGPVYAIPMVLKNTGLSIRDVDLFEVYHGRHSKEQGGMLMSFGYIDQRSLCFSMRVLHSGTGVGS